MDYVVFTMEDSFGNEISVDSNSGMMLVQSDSVTVNLSQEQTLALSDGDIQMQLRASNSDGSSAIASNFMYSVLDNILKEGVIP